MLFPLMLLGLSAFVFQLDTEKTLATRESNGYISIYSLSTQHLALRFKVYSKDLQKPDPLGESMDTVLSITDLDGGYVLVYTRSFGMQIWHWTLNGSTLPATLVGTRDKTTLNSSLFIPPAPRLVASYSVGSISFCCPSVLQDPPEKTSSFQDGSVRRVKWIAAPYGEGSLIQIIRLSLPPLTADSGLDSGQFAWPNDSFFTRTSHFQTAPEKNMAMSLKLYSKNKLEKATVKWFLLAGFEDGTIQWYLLEMNQDPKATQIYPVLIWELPRLHFEAALAVVVSEDLACGFSVGIDGKLARFDFDYSGAEVCLALNCQLISQKANIQKNGLHSADLARPALGPPNLESLLLHTRQLDVGCVCASIKGGTITIGHTDNSIGIYSIANLRLVRKLNFHRKSILYILHFDAAECISRTMNASSLFIFASSQDSRVSLWEAS